MKKIIAVTTILFTSHTFAEGWGAGIYMEQGSVDQDVAIQEGMGEALQGGGVSISWQTKANSIGAFQIQSGIGFVSASDQDRYAVATVDSNDNQGYRTSSVGGTNWFMEAGYDKQFESNYGAFVNLGYSSYGLNRSISACSDCPTEAVDLSDANYLHLGGSVKVTPISNIRIGYQHYFSGDIINNLKIQWLIP